MSNPFWFLSRAWREKLWLQLSDAEREEASLQLLEVRRELRVARRSIDEASRALAAFESRLEQKGEQ